MKLFKIILRKPIMEILNWLAESEFINRFVGDSTIE